MTAQGGAPDGRPEGSNTGLQAASMLAIRRFCGDLFPGLFPETTISLVLRPPL
jgi:hypothetical protein